MVDLTLFKELNFACPADCWRRWGRLSSRGSSIAREINGEEPRAANCRRRSSRFGEKPRLLRAKSSFYP